MITYLKNKKRENIIKTLIKVSYLFFCIILLTNTIDKLNEIATENKNLLEVHFHYVNVLKIKKV